MQIISPFKRLDPGGLIALIAPAGPFEVNKYEKGVEMLHAAGYRTAPGKSIYKKQNYLAGTDEERLLDLVEAFADPEIGAILCIRGGYGSGRLLPRIPFRSLSAHAPKLFIGHSDITFLHLGLIARLKWTTFHGPNLLGMSESAQRSESVLRTLTGEASYEWILEPKQIIRPGKIQGPVLGGNLCCLSHMIGTPYMPDMAGALLLIEDCGEALYKLDRMINHLKLAGILPSLGAILLGEFTGCAPYRDICGMVMNHVRDYDFPVIKDLPVGHGERTEVIPFGPPFELETDGRTLKILQAPVLR